VKYRTVAYASAALLLAAIWDWPYGFYTFLRIAVSVTTAYGAARAFSNDEARWGVILSAI
jgi:hypothetical protein